MHAKSENTKSLAFQLPMLTREWVSLYNISRKAKVMTYDPDLIFVKVLERFHNPALHLCGQKKNTCQTNMKEKLDKYLKILPENNNKKRLEIKKSINPPKNLTFYDIHVYKLRQLTQFRKINFLNVYKQTNKNGLVFN